VGNTPPSEEKKSLNSNQEKRRVRSAKKGTGKKQATRDRAQPHAKKFPNDRKL